MSTITLKEMDLQSACSHSGVQLRTPSGVMATIRFPELVWRPNEVRCWLNRSEGVLIITATHASRIFRILLETGTTEVVAGLDRRISEVLGDQIQFVACRQACGGTLLILYESGLVCLESNGDLRWHRPHNDITAMFLAVDEEYVCIEKHPTRGDTTTRTYFRLADGYEIPYAA